MRKDTINSENKGFLKGPMFNNPNEYESYIESYNLSFAE